jgi:excisionase family DNA binding protein
LPKIKSIYTTHDVSRLLHVNPRSVINWVDQERMPSFRTPGGHRRIRHEDLMAFLRKQQIPIPPALVGDQFIVLVVEAESSVTDTIKTALESQGRYGVHTASDGISALIELGRLKPDLMILDIAIPGVDAADVCKRIKADPGNKTAIILIGHSGEGVESNADASLPKPLDIGRLLAETNRLLRTM